MSFLDNLFRSFPNYLTRAQTFQENEERVQSQFSDSQGLNPAGESQQEFTSASPTRFQIPIGYSEHYKKLGYRLQNYLENFESHQINRRQFRYQLKRLEDEIANKKSMPQNEKEHFKAHLDFLWAFI